MSVDMPAGSVTDRIRGELFIGGRRRQSSDGGQITVLDPANGEPITTVATATVQDGLAAVSAAAAALPGWPPPRRGPGRTCSARSAI